MSKKAAYYQLAKVAYIYEGKTFREIELQLNEEVTERTLRTWSADGDWREKRKQYLESQKTIREKLDELRYVLVNHAIETKDPQVIYALVGLVKAMNPISAKSRKAIEDEAKKPEGSGISDETMAQFKRDFLGIKDE